MRALSTYRLYWRIWSKTTILVVLSLALDSLLGTSFIDHHVRAMLPGIWKVGFYHFLSVAITVHRFSTTPKTILTLQLDDQSQRAWTTRRVAIPSTSQEKLQAHSPIRGLCFVQKAGGLAIKHDTLIPSGIKDTFPQILSDVLLSVFSLCPFHISKNTVVGHGLKATERSFTVEAFKPHLLQSKELGGTAENLDSFVEDSPQQPDLDPEQWRRGLHICSQKNRADEHQAPFVRVCEHARAAPKGNHHC